MPKANKPRKPVNNFTRIERLENKMEWLLKDAFMTLSNSVAEQASACQAVLKVLAELHPERRMVKCVSVDGRVFYEFKLITEIEAEKAKQQSVEVLEADQNDKTIQQPE